MVRVDSNKRRQENKFLQLQPQKEQQQLCHQQSFYQIMILMSGMVSGLKYHSHPEHPSCTSRSRQACWFHVALRKYQIHTDAESTWSKSLFIFFHFSVGDKLSLARFREVQLAIKPQYLNTVGNISVIKPFFTRCSRKFSYLSSSRWCTSSIFSTKGTVNSMT